MGAKPNCRVCTLLDDKGQGTQHDEARMHSDAPAVSITSLIAERLRKPRKR